MKCFVSGNVDTSVVCRLYMVHHGEGIKGMRSGFSNSNVSLQTYRG